MALATFILPTLETTAWSWFRASAARRTMPGMRLLIATPLLMLACVPLVSGLRGGYILRWLAIAVLLFLTIGLNTMIEAKIFRLNLARHRGVVRVPRVLSGVRDVCR